MVGWNDGRQIDALLFKGFSCYRRGIPTRVEFNFSYPALAHGLLFQSLDGRGDIIFLSQSLAGLPVLFIKTQFPFGNTDEDLISRFFCLRDLIFRISGI